MDFADPPEAAAFRGELRAWLEANLDDRFRAHDSRDLTPAERVALLREWTGLLAEAGYAAIQWPVEHRGRGAGLLEQVVLAEEMTRAGAPPNVNADAIAHIAPAIMLHGKPEQKTRFLPPMRCGEDVWSQGFSEPGAGSDLASLTTRAEDMGEYWLVNGRKVWNSFGEFASRCQLLVRTNPDKKQHAGISCLLVDLSLPGVEVRPTTTITGEREFAELVFTNLRVPKDAVLGEVDGGWAVAMTTLTSERASVATLHLGVNARIRDLVADLRALGRPLGERDRERLARLVLHGRLLDRLSERALSALLHGRAGPEGSLTKLVWSDVEQELGEVAADLLGVDALGGRWAKAKLVARSYSIAGGTTQVNKNIVAQRVLGLPRRD